MPPRLVFLGILVFWLLMTGVFLSTDFYPRFYPSEPTLFAIEVIDEAGQQIDNIGWSVYKNDEDTYLAQSDWAYDPEQDTFKATCTLQRNSTDDEIPRPGHQTWPPDVKNMRMDNSYRVRRSRRIERLETKTSYECTFPGLRAEPVRLEAVLEGNPDGRRMDLQATVSCGPSQDAPENPQPFPVPVTLRQEDQLLSVMGHIVNPLHPQRRLHDLHPGQEWILPVIDPLAVPGLPGGERTDPLVHLLRARVLSDMEVITWEGKQVGCRVIEAEGDGPVSSMRIWVRGREGDVLRHEVVLWGDEWRFVRRLHPVRVIRPRTKPVPAPTNRTSLDEGRHNPVEPVPRLRCPGSVLCGVGFSREGWTFPRSSGLALRTSRG